MRVLAATSFATSSPIGLSQVRAGELVGRDGRTSQRWAADGVPPEASIIFQLLLDGKITVDDVDAARKRGRA